MWRPASESEETEYLNVKQANEITLRQIKNAAQTIGGEIGAVAAATATATTTTAAAIPTADYTELENLLEDIDGQEDDCTNNVQQLLPQSSSASLRANCAEIPHAEFKQQQQRQQQHHHQTIKDDVVDEDDDDFAIAAAAHQDKAHTGRTVINVGSTTDNVDTILTAAADNAINVAQIQQQTEQLNSDKMTQYGNTGGSHAHSKLDIQKFSEGMQQQQQQRNGATIIPTQPTSLNATTTATATTTTIAQGVVGINTGNINNEGNGPALPSAHAPIQYKGPKFWRYIQRHWADSSQLLALFVIFLLTWALAYCLMPDYVKPNTGIMRILLLFIGAQLAGIAVTHLRLPDMLGMLFFGVFYTNVGLADFSGYQRLEAFLREMALINIMLLAGLGLNAAAFKKLWFMILRLTVLPTVAEVAIIALLARFLLSMPWLWGILMGLVITAVSPNVVVTVMLKLKEDRLGLNSGIHTIIYATTTCNDVLSIFAFGVVLGIVFSTGSLTEQILQGPVGIGIGIVFGYIYGMMLQYLPSTKSNYMNGLRFVLTILGGSVAVMGSKAIGYPSAGALGCASLAFIASIGWKRQQQQAMLQRQQQQQQWQSNANENSSVPKRLDLLWKFLKPVSFALIGKEINFAALDAKVVGYGLLLILLGSLLRLAFGYVSTYGGGLTWKERAYITISGFPKATVQAALGPIALDLARSLNVIDQEQVSFAGNVLVISVLAIIFTAPLGAILMLRLAPHWLQHNAASGNGNGSGDGYGDAVDGVGSNRGALGYDSKKNAAVSDGDALTNSLARFAPQSNLSYRSNKSQSTIDVATIAGNTTGVDDNVVVVVAPAIADAASDGFSRTRLEPKIERH